jgi:hypothetical protein
MIMKAIVTAKPVRCKSVGLDGNKKDPSAKYKQDVRTYIMKKKEKTLTNGSTVTKSIDDGLSDSTLLGRMRNSIGYPNAYQRTGGIYSLIR